MRIASLLIVSILASLTLAATSTNTQPTPGSLRTKVDEKSFDDIVAKGQLLAPPAPQFNPQGRFLVAPDADTVHCYDAQAKEQWVAKPGRAPILLGSASGLAIIVVADHVVALNWQTGQTPWNLPRPAADSYVALREQTLLLQTANTLQAHAADTGKLLWKAALPGAIEHLEYGTGHIALRCQDAPRDYLLLDAKTGAATPIHVDADSRWFGLSPTGDLLLLEDRQLSAYRAADQKQAFVVPLPANPARPAPVVAKDRIVILDPDPKQPAFLVVSPAGKISNFPLRAFFVSNSRGANMQSDGQTIFAWSEDSLQAFDVSQQDERRMVKWTATPLQSTPPRRDVEFDTQLVFNLYQGAGGSRGTNITKMALYNRLTGRANAVVNLPALDAKELGKSAFRSWEVIEGGVVFDIGGEIHLLRVTNTP